MDERDRDEEPKGEGKPRRLLLDMGLGSREQGFCKQEAKPTPKLKLVHSSEASPA